MKLQERDKRALLLLGGASAVFAVVALLPGGNGQPKVVGVSDSIPAAEKRLARARQLAASVPGKEQVLKDVSAELAAREKSILQAETAAQAQAQLVDVIRRVAKAQTPPLEFGAWELSQQVARLGEDYGEVQVTVPFTCHIEELVNFLADLTKQPEAAATTDLRITAADAKQKTMNVRLAIAGLVPRRLVPQKRGPVF